MGIVLNSCLQVSFLKSLISFNLPIHPGVLVILHSFLLILFLPLLPLPGKSWSLLFLILLFSVSIRLLTKSQSFHNRVHKGIVEHVSHCMQEVVATIRLPLPLLVAVVPRPFWTIKLEKKHCQY